MCIRDSSTSVSKPAWISSQTPPHRTACSPNRSVSVSSLKAVSYTHLVLVPNCDKIVPGMVMAAVRMDVPAVVCSGGPMLAGSYGARKSAFPRCSRPWALTRPV